MLQDWMVVVEAFVDALNHFAPEQKEGLKQHLAGLGADPHSEYDAAVKETLRDNLPSWLNSVQRTAVRQAVRDPGNAHPAQPVQFKLPLNTWLNAVQTLFMPACTRAAYLD